MGPLLALNCPCFRKNVIVTCRIVALSCSLDNFLLKNVIVYIFGIHILKWRPFEKRAIFDPFFIFFSHQGKDRTLQHIILHENTYFAHPFDFFALPILQKNTNLVESWGMANTSFPAKVEKKT